MDLSLPRLDDRAWADLVEEARSLIPVYAAEWTDHNASDPGITFIELLAWIAEMDIFQLDQVPEPLRRAFLALVGVAPAAATPARTVVEVTLRPGARPLTLPAGVEFEGHDPHGRATRVRTLLPLRATASRLTALHAASGDGHSSLDLAATLSRGAPALPFGDDPRPGDSMVLHIDPPVPPRTPLTVVAAPEYPDAQSPLEHHSARTQWDVASPSGRWRPLSAREVRDATRCLTRTGTVVITAKSAFSRLRCRLVRAGYDAAPVLSGLAVNAAPAEQSVPVGTARWETAPGADVPAAVAPGRTVRLGVRLDAHGRVTGWDPGDTAAPTALVLDRGRDHVTVEAADLGPATGAPEQSYALAGEPARLSGLWTLEVEGDQHAWRRWWLTPSLTGSGPAAHHATADPATGRITFGDGAHGRVPPRGARILAVGRTSAGPAGNLPAGHITALADSAHNRAVLAAARIAPEEVRAVANTIALKGGSAPEALPQAEARAARTVEETPRAVTLADHERLALGTPGVRLARAAARANRHPAFPCVTAPGVVWLTVLPYLPAGRPVPGPGLLAAVRAHLHAHRVLGTRVEVTGPVYRWVTVRARIEARGPDAPADLARAAVRALDAHFDPLTGGPHGDGWPLGRDVDRAEILRVLDAVPGVSHATGLELLTDDGTHCGRVRVPPGGLVESGPHEIEVLRT
ncbi:putative baseplate assembly protein [Streptomyces sp. WG-D5]